MCAYHEDIWERECDTNVCVVYSGNIQYESLSKYWLLVKLTVVFLSSSRWILRWSLDRGLKYFIPFSFWFTMYNLSFHLVPHNYCSLRRVIKKPWTDQSKMIHIKELYCKSCNRLFSRNYEIFQLYKSV